jgi:Histidine phosphatase superfamily (branch 1)
MRAIGRLGAALTAAVFCAFLCAVAPAADTPDTLAGARLLSALRDGGLILYFRHTSTDFGQNDDQMSGYEDCARQRNLTDRGREEARQIGAAIRRLGIPVGEVLASPFCRTRETAQLIFGRATVSPAVRGGPASPGSNERYAQLRHLLSTPPSPGSNLAIASHGNPFRAVSDAAYLAEGEAAVVRPLGPQGFKVIARIPKDGWDALATP